MSLTLYSASAGSGKTYTLAQKYITLALSSDSPTAYASILAVTFTNKATGEMKDRILSQLYNLSRGGIYDKAFFDTVCQSVHTDDATLQRRAAAALSSIVHDYDHFRVETIDSFFQSLLTNMAHELGLTRGFRVELNDKLTVSQAVDRLLLTLEDAKTAVQEPWLRKSVETFMKESIEDNKGWKVGSQIKKFAHKNLYDTVYQQHDEEIERLAQNEEVMKALGEAYHQIIREFEKTLADGAREIQRLSSQIRSLHTKCGLSGYLTKLTTKDFNKVDEAKISSLIDDSRRILKKSGHSEPLDLAQAAEVVGIAADLEAYRKAHLTRYNSCVLARQNLHMLSLLSSIGREVSRMTEQNGTFLLAKTPELFNRVVSGSDSSFVFERAGTTFHHVMIDEFQDTSIMQWSNFRKLLIESIAEGKESMLVGDIKQSIYRWRGGDWRIFHGIPQKFKNVSVCSLSHNYRSDRTVVKFNNAFFVKAATYVDNAAWDVPADWETTDDQYVTPELLEQCEAEKTMPDSILSLYRDAEQRVKPQAGEGYVHIALGGTGVVKEDVMDDMYDRIETLHRQEGVPYGRMGILVRYNHEADDIISYFSSAHPDVPITSDVAFHYASSPLVMLIVCTLKYIDDENDTVALEMMYHIYISLIKEEDDETADGLYSSFNRFVDSLSTQDAKEDGEQACMRREWQSMPLYELIHRITRTLGLDRLKKALHHQEAYLYSFLDLVTDYLDRNSSDLHSFLDKWDEQFSEKSITTTAMNAVSILTIHKAKGLQMHTVFIPFADYKFFRAKQDSYLWCETQKKETDDEKLRLLLGTLPLLSINYSSDKIKNSVFEPDLAEEKCAQYIDSLNTLYVAFTRAEKNLFIWSTHQTEPSVYNLIEAFVYNLQPGANPGVKEADADDTDCVFDHFTYGSLHPFEEKERSGGETSNPFENRIDGSAEVCLSSNEMSDITFRQSNAAKDFVADLQQPEESEKRKTRREYINRGLLYHHIFSLIRTREDVESAVQTAVREGQIASREDGRAIADEIQSFLSQQDVAEWFSGRYRILSENDILLPIAPDAGRPALERPDRIMTDENETIVLDYKFGVRKAAHIDQVKDYVEILKEMGYKNVSGYLWYVFNRQIIKVTDETE